MNNKIKFISNLFWRYAERSGAQIVTFLVSVVLARILEPSVYGTVALITVFTNILQVFVDSGLGNALIQKKGADNTDFSTVFFFNIAFCLALYALLFIAAPLLATFYKNAALTPYIRVLGLTIVISGVKNVQQAYVSRNMLFKRFFFATLAGTIGAAVIGIWMAYHGFGVWSLIAQQLFNLAVDTLVLWLTVKWRPILRFSWGRFKQLFGFGWKMLVSSLLDTIYIDLSQLVIGKFYTESALAFYNRGGQFPRLIVGNINSSINSVLLPTMAADQDHKDRVRQMVRRSITISTYIMAPLMVGLAVLAPQVVHLLLTDKWLPCVFYLRIFCFVYAFYPIHTANLNAITAMGRSDLFLKLEIEKKVLGFTLLLITAPISVKAMAYSSLVSTMGSILINAAPNRKLLDYSYRQQLRDILPYLVLAIAMGAVVWSVGLLPLPFALLLLIQVLIGAVFYIGVSCLLKLDCYQYLMGIMRTAVKKK